MKYRLTIVFLLIAASAAFVRMPSVGKSVLISPAFAQALITAHEAMLGNTSVGEVMANGEVLFRIRTSAGGYTPSQRAQIVADRLQGLMQDNLLTANDITTGRRDGQEVVLAKGNVIATADVAHARLNQTTPVGLADYWATRVENVVGGRQVADTQTSQKIVPIISLGSGARLGGALVTGSASSVKEVVAVAQLEGTFQSAVRIRVLVPVSTENIVQNIKRVPGASVTGLVDVKL